MKRLNKYFLIVLTVFVVMLALSLQLPTRSYAAETWTGSGPYNNPFPEFLPDEEIKAELEKYQAKPEQERTFSWVYANWVEHNGVWRRYYWTDYVFYQPGDHVRHVCAVVGQSPYANSFAKYCVYAPEARLAFDPENPAERLHHAYLKSVSAQIDYAKFYGDQSLVVPGTQDDDLPSFEVRFDSRTIDSPRYIIVDFVIPYVDASAYSPLQSGVHSAGGQGNSGFPLGLAMKPGDFVIVNTDFLPFDEFDYRAAMGLSLEDPILPRSEGDGKDSNKPFENEILQKLNTIPGAEIIRSTSAFGRSYNPYEQIEVPIFRPEDSEITDDINPKKTPAYFFSPNLETFINYAGDKPRLSEVRDPNRIPGYVLVADNIDTQINETSNAGAARQGIDKGKLTNDSAYVLLYRSLARPIVINKFDASDPSKKLAGASFELRRVNSDGSYSEVITTVTTDAEGRATTAPSANYDEMRTGVITATGLDLATRSYTMGENIYFAQGNYVLIETQTPEGYEPLSDPITIEVAAPSDPSSWEFKLDVPNKPIPSIPTTESDPQPGSVIPKTGDLTQEALGIFSLILGTGASLSIFGFAQAFGKRSKHN